MRIVIKYSMVTMINSKWKQVSRKELKISKNLCSNFSRIISNFFKWQLIKKNYANLCNHYFLIKLQLDYSLNKIQTFTPKYGRNCAWNRDEEFVPFLFTFFVSEQGIFHSDKHHPIIQSWTHVQNIRNRRAYSHIPKIVF